MKVNETKYCTYCNNIIDYIEHFFFECQHVKKLWNNVGNQLSLHLETKVVITLEMALFGVKGGQYSVEKTNYINKVILIAKMCISICKKTNNINQLQYLFDYHIHLRDEYCKGKL